MESEKKDVRRHVRTQLRQVSRIRVVGFQDAVDDLGTHLVCGHSVNYSRTQVYNVLTGRVRSDKLLRRIAEKRPDLLDLYYVTDEVRAKGREFLREVS